MFLSGAPSSSARPFALPTETARAKQSTSRLLDDDEFDALMTAGAVRTTAVKGRGRGGKVPGVVPTRAARHPAAAPLPYERARAAERTALDNDDCCDSSGSVYSSGGEGAVADDNGEDGGGNRSGDDGSDGDDDDENESLDDVRVTAKGAVLLPRAFRQRRLRPRPAAVMPARPKSPDLIPIASDEQMQPVAAVTAVVPPAAAPHPPGAPALQIPTNVASQTLKPGAVLLADGRVQLPDGRFVLQDGTLVLVNTAAAVDAVVQSNSRVGRDWFADDDDEVVDGHTAAVDQSAVYEPLVSYEPADEVSAAAYNPAIRTAPMAVPMPLRAVLTFEITPLGEKPLQALLTVLYARWRCRVCGERSSSAEELSVHVAAHRAGAGVIAHGVDVVAALRAAHARSDATARASSESLGPVVGCARGWFRQHT